MIKQKIGEEPKNIEELTEIREYMQGLPAELEKIKLDMKKCFDIYIMLEDFNWRFSQDDMNRRWNVFAGPRDVMKLVDDRTNALEKLKAKFQEEMKTEQEEFKDEFETLGQTISGFHSYQDIKAHSDVAKTVLDIQASL